MHVSSGGVARARSRRRRLHFHFPIRSKIYASRVLRASHAFCARNSTLSPRQRSGRTKIWPKIDRPRRGQDSWLGARIERGLESRSSSTRARKRIRDYNNSGAERFLPREQRTNTQILIGDPPISASIHNLVQISTMSRQQRRSTQMQFAYPRPFSALYVAGSGKGWKGVAMVEGGSIFGKYLWRVETTELERTYSISLPALVERRMFVSRSEYHSGAPGKSRGSVGVIESVIHQRSSGMLIPPVADVHRSLGKKKKGKTRVIVVAISAASGRVASSHPRASIAFSRGP